MYDEAGVLLYEGNYPMGAKFGVLAFLFLVMVVYIIALEDFSYRLGRADQRCANLNGQVVDGQCAHVEVIDAGK